MNSETTPTSNEKFPIKMLLLIVPLVFAMGIGTGWAIWGINPAQAAAAESPAQQSAVTNPQQAAPSQQNIVRYDVPEDGDPAIGRPDAPITIIEFSDYQCPFCKRWHDEVYLRILADYPDQVRIVYRDFPLASIHPDATSAAEAAECANEQNKYWEYHSALFGGEYGLGREAYLTYAANLGLDVPSFTTCIDERRYQDEVQADFDYAAQFGVRSTPTFFLNGIALIGAQPYEVFKQIIDEELAGKIP